MDKLRIGLLGFGTVGTGVVKTIQKNQSLIQARTGILIEIGGIADLDITRDRGVSVPLHLLTTDVFQLVHDPNIDCIVELIGGTSIAKELICQAVRNHKPVVTANKALLATHGEEIFSLARNYHTDVYYEASVGGGIPIIKSLKEGLVANHIQAIYGILNGTCNYILTRMLNDRLSFHEALQHAQKQGYAEANPSLDIGGIDTAHKTIILASLAFGHWFPMKYVHIEGIEHIELTDLLMAREMGYKVKLLGIVKHNEGSLPEIRVHPCLISQHHQLASIDDVFNGIYIVGDIVGTTLFYGRGAGQMATASAVVADIVDIGLNRKKSAHSRVSPFQAHTLYPQKVAAIGEIETRYYLRFQVEDQPGVLGKISTILGNHHISIASVRQTEIDQPTVPVIFITHRAKEENIQRALSELVTLETIKAKPVVIRIEDILT